MRTQDELKELYEIYEKEYFYRIDEGLPVNEFSNILSNIRAQIIEEVPIEQPSDPEPGDPEPSQLKD